MKRSVAGLIFFSIFLLRSTEVNALTERELIYGLSQIKNTQMGISGNAHLAEILEKALKFYGSVEDYETKFFKTERAKGSLGQTEEIFIKFEKTFKIYMRWLNTEKKGVEVVYERGKRKGKLAVHQPGLLFGLAPVILLDQNSPWIKEGSESYNIEDAGIGTFLVDFTRDVIRAQGENNLRVEMAGQSSEEGLTGEKAGVTFLNSSANSGYIAYRLNVLFDQHSNLPVKMEFFDWQNKLMGIYTYKDLQINVGSNNPTFKKQINRHLLKIYYSKK